MEQKKELLQQPRNEWYLLPKPVAVACSDASCPKEVISPEKGGGTQLSAQEQAKELQRDVRWQNELDMYNEKKRRADDMEGERMEEEERKSALLNGVLQKKSVDRGLSRAFGMNHSGGEELPL